MKFR